MGLQDWPIERGRKDREHELADGKEPSSQCGSFWSNSSASPFPRLSCRIQGPRQTLLRCWRRSIGWALLHEVQLVVCDGSEAISLALPELTWNRDLRDGCT